VCIYIHTFTSWSLPRMSFIGQILRMHTYAHTYIHAYIHTASIMAKNELHRVDVARVISSRLGHDEIEIREAAIE
jgi:hypothetical protein